MKGKGRGERERGRTGDKHLTLLEVRAVRVDVQAKRTANVCLFRYAPLFNAEPETDRSTVAAVLWQVVRFYCC